MFCESPTKARGRRGDNEKVVEKADRSYTGDSFNRVDSLGPGVFSVNITEQLMLGFAIEHSEKIMVAEVDGLGRNLDGDTVKDHVSYHVQDA